MNALEGQVAVVTGAGSGIGEAIARRFVAEGAFVYLVGRRRAALQAVAADLGEHCAVISGDTAVVADIEHVFKRIRTRHGRVDVLVSSAGGGAFGPLGEITEESFDALFASNVKGVVFTVQEALPLLTDGAAIVLIGSATAATGAPGASAFAAAKAAVRNLARSWLVELADRRIRVNVLSPGPTLTPGLVGLVSEADRDALLEQVTADVPLGRLADPTEIADAALFLAGGQSSFVNGVELFVDGGVAQT
jgi:NAD(P)-dependent dehydrogenase (short-subunit alcohol dehydrogenase family)